MSSLRELREAFKQARADFESRKAHEWELESKSYQVQIALEVRRLHEVEGRSKASIMREYGTSDFRTIQNLLTSVPTLSPENKVKWTNEGDGRWTVHDDETTATVIPLHDEEDLYIESGKLPAGITYKSLPRDAYPVVVP